MPHSKSSRNIKIQRSRRRGVTLLEVLLYIGLFSILCISIIFLYISISRTAFSIKSSIQRAEFSFFVYEICRYKIDTYGYGAFDAPHQIRIEDFSRILRFYPNLRMTELSVGPNDADGSSGTNAASSSDRSFRQVKITYKLIRAGVNAMSDKIISNTIYINEL
jgi:hypothetical protein